MTEIKAVLFDLRDTLLNVSDAYANSKKYLDYYLTKQGLNLSPDQTQQDLKVTIKETIQRVGTPTDVHNWDAIFTKELFNHYKLTLSEAEFSEFLGKYAEAFADKAVLYPDAKLILEQLRHHNIKTGVVIDGTVKREQLILKTTGLTNLLDTITISEEVGQNKFTPEPLNDALRKIAVAPTNILAVGDRYDKDILHANKAGCITAKLERDQGRYSALQPANEDQKPKYIIHTLLELKDIIGI